MAGLSLHAAGSGRATTTASVNTASIASTSGGASAGAFGPGSTTSAAAPLNPTKPVGLAFAVGVTAIVLLVLVRHSLPA